jgi:hypothetical protein
MTDRRCQAVAEIAVTNWKARPGRASLDIGGQEALGGSVSFGKGPAPVHLARTRQPGPHAGVGKWGARQRHPTAELMAAMVCSPPCRPRWTALTASDNGKSAICQDHIALASPPIFSAARTQPPHFVKRDVALQAALTSKMIVKKWLLPLWRWQWCWSQRIWDSSL